MRRKTKEIFDLRPYLDNPNSTCGGCGIIRYYRSMHCPFCKSCIAKHSRHSILFGVCIGAANELFALLFFLSLFLTQAGVLWLFSHLSYGIITKVLFYLMNGAFCWMSFTEFAKLAILVIHPSCRTSTTASLRENSRPGACNNTSSKYLRGSSRTTLTKDPSRTSSTVYPLP